MKYLNSIKNNPVFKVSSLNVVNVLVKIAGGLVASKIIAIFLGPSGLAFVGNFRNFIRQAEVFGTLGFENGIIKYVAQYEKDKAKLKQVITTIFITIFVAVAVASILLLFFAGWLSTVYFDSDANYAWIFRVMAVALPFYVGNLVFIGVLNGLTLYKDVMRVNMTGNIVGVLISAVLIWQYNINGALIGLLATPSLIFLFSFFLFRKRLGSDGVPMSNLFDVGILKGLFSYTTMSLVTALLSPIVAVSIRTHLMKDFSADEAGFWEGMTRISFFYQMFVATLLTVYFFPKLSAAKDNLETHNVFMSYYKFVIPVFAGGLVLVYLLRSFIVGLVLDEDFLPMTSLFKWQLLGDFLKACSLILGYEFFAKKLTKQFIITELMSISILYLSSHYLITLYGSEGAVMAHAFTYAVYLIVLGIYFRNTIFRSTP